MNGYATHKYHYDGNKKEYYWSDDYSYNLGMAHGIPGVVAALSLICLQGKGSSEGISVLRKLSQFLFDIQQRTRGKLLPGEIDVLKNTEKPLYSTRCAWCYGNPGFAMSLKLASEALNSKKLKKIQKELIDDMQNSPFKQWKISSPMICHGYSGVLEILLRLKNYQVIEEFDLINKILGAINLEKRYCFENNNFGNEKDICGFLEGSTGIFLTLINLLTENEAFWDQVLLIS